MIELSNNNLVIIILFIIFIYSITKNCSVFNNNNILDGYDNYIPFRNVENNQCFDYLTFDGNRYHLYKVRKPYIRNKNPLEFNDYQELILFIKDNYPDCKNIPFVNLNISKDNSDPTENAEWKCSRKVSNREHKLNLCNQELELNNGSELVLEKINNLINDENYIKEKCMFDEIIRDFKDRNELSKNNSNEFKFMNEINTFY